MNTVWYEIEDFNDDNGRLTFKGKKDDPENPLMTYGVNASAYNYYEQSGISLTVFWSGDEEYEEGEPE